VRTERRYYDLPTPEPFPAEIRELRPLGDRTALLLDRTIFYPEGGGQEGDRGSVNGVPLVDVKETAEGEILHLAAAADARSLEPGPATLLLDLRRRRDFTVQHSAQHLLSGLILRLAGNHTVSMHLSRETNTIDVDAPELPPDVLCRVEDAAAEAVESDVPIVIHLYPPEDITQFPLRKVPPRGKDVIRVVEIAGNDFSPCCGTHCTSTGQIGILKILGAEKYKGMTRVSFIAGRRVLADSRVLRRNGEIISRALKVPVAETGVALLALLERNAAVERELKALREAAAEQKAEALLERAAQFNKTGEVPPLIIETYNSAFDEVMRIGRAAQKKTTAILLLASGPEKKFAALCSDKKTDLRSLLGAATAGRGGKGGGAPGFFQGVFESRDALESFLRDMV
jgi:alanyl-tRNA synthetase